MSLFGGSKTSVATRNMPITADAGSIAAEQVGNVSYGLTDIQLHDFLDTLKTFSGNALEEVKSSLNSASATIQQSNNPTAGTVGTIVTATTSSAVDIIKQLALPITLVIGAVIFFKVIK